MPTISWEGDLYTYPTFPQRGFSDYILHSVTYVSSYTTTSSPHFLCLAPYVEFGLCDLMWQTPKMPRHGCIAPKVTSSGAIVKIIEKHLDKNVIVPQPLRDRLIPAPIGYHSFYEKPKRFLIEKGRALVYNNELYTIFLI